MHTRFRQRMSEKAPNVGQVDVSLTTLSAHDVQFYAMVNFCNPGVLGTPAEFRKKYERPILEGREPGVGPEKVSACA